MLRHNYASFKSYLSLLADPKPSAKKPVRWISQSYGDGRALAFRGSRQFIGRCANLFANFDWRPAVQVSNDPPIHAYPASPKLRRRYDAQHICVSPELLREILTNYFRASLVYFGDVPRVTTVSPTDSDDIDYTHDEAEVERLAPHLANHFIENDIHVEPFMIEEDATILVEHGISPGERAE